MRKDDWFDYVKVGYDLINEHASLNSIKLTHVFESQIVHIFAKNFRRTDIGVHPVAMQLMEAVNRNDKVALGQVGDECLIIQSFPLRVHKWPSNTYYIDMGVIGYGLAGNEIMEKNFITASKILNSMLRQQL